jgi:hypothetical protein
MTLRMTIEDILLERIPEDRRFFLDIKFYGIPSVFNSTLWAIKNRWPGCEGVSVAFDPGFPIDPDIEDEQFRLVVYPLYGEGGPFHEPVPGNPEHAPAG